MCQKRTKMVQGWNRFVSSEPQDAKILEIDFFQSGNGMKNYSKPPRLTAFFFFQMLLLNVSFLPPTYNCVTFFCCIHHCLEFRKPKCAEPILDPRVL